jgi:prepilin-type N-terminal cleavage/methylation domain-containing protein
MAGEKRGFTLLEVIVALGITATALLLVLASNNDALRRCISSRQTETVEWLAESKLAELSCGAETSRQGSFPNSDLSWEASVETASIPEVSGLQKITLRIYHTQTPAFTLKTVSQLLYAPGGVHGL